MSVVAGFWGLTDLLVLLVLITGVLVLSHDLLLRVIRLQGPGLAFVRIPR